MKMIENGAHVRLCLQHRLLVAFTLLAITASLNATPACGPGPHWIDTCPAGFDDFNSSAQVGLNFPGLGAFTLNLTGPLLIFRGPGTTVPDHHIDTEMVSMNLTGIFMGNPITLLAGDGTADLMRTPGPRAALYSPGRITEVPGDPTLADSFFDVFFELQGTPFGTLHNNVAHVDSGRIAFVPPFGYEYRCLNCPIPLFDPQGNLVGTVTSVVHLPIPEPNAMFLLGPGLALILYWRQTSTRNRNHRAELLTGQEGGGGNGFRARFGRGTD